MTALDLHARRRDPVIQAWVELRFAPEPISLIDIADAVIARGAAVWADVRRIGAAIGEWIKSGHAVSSDRGHRFALAGHAMMMADPPAPRATPLPSVRAPRVRTPRQRMWTAARILKRFDLVQFRMAAAVTMRQAKDFLRVMTRAGFLAVDPAAQDQLRWVTGPRGLGPQPPSVLHLNLPGGSVMRVVDRNSGDVIDVPMRSHGQRGRGEG